MTDVGWRLDHVTIAGSVLSELETACRSHGMEPSYGGRHGDGQTHMAQVTFGDGTYLELISTVDDGASSPVWPGFIEDDGGACGWAVQVPDVAAATERLRALDIAVDGPDRYRREREDGTEVAWEMAVPGSWAYPILVADRTARERRLGPISEGPYRGIDRILLGVESLDPHVARLRELFDSAEKPERGREGERRVASFQHPPLTLMAPTGGGWLQDRLDRFGEAPLSFHFERGDGGVVDSRTWFGHRSIG